MTQLDPLPGLARKFLGIPDGENPLALLGVDAALLDVGGPGAVVRALEARLVAIDQHIERATPAADELRLALHAMAAQMLDPVVRQGVIERWGTVPVAVAAVGGPAVAAGEDAQLVGARLSLEGDALLAIAMEGGWNQRSLERLCMFAHARGLTAEDVAATLRALGRSPTASIAGPTARSDSPSSSGPSPRPSDGLLEPAAEAVDRSSTPVGPKLRPVPVYVPPKPRVFELSDAEIEAMGRQRLRVAFGIAAGAAIGLFALATGIFILLKSSPSDKPGQAAPEGTNPNRGSVAKTPTPAKPVEPKNVPQPPADRTDGETVRQMLDAAASAVKTNAKESGKRFEDAIKLAGEHWTKWKTDELAVVTEAAVDYLYKVAEDAAQTRAAAASMSAMVDASAGVPRAAFGAGLLARVLAESNLPAGVLGPARLALAQAAGTDQGLDTFKAGAGAALTIRAGTLAAQASVEGWKSWLVCSEVLHAGDAAERGRSIAVALDRALVSGPDPTADRGAFDSIGLLALALTWRVEEQSRPWLLRWFDTPSVSVGALHALTSALAARSGAEGVSSTMTLAAKAGPGERADLRARYAEVWGLAGTAAGDAFAVEWLAAYKRVSEQADVRAEASGTMTTAVGALMKAVALSRLSEAAALSWSGDRNRAQSLVTDPDTLAKLRVAATNAAVRNNGGKLFGADNDGAWAAKYLGLGNNVPNRTEMLKQAQAASALTAVECEIVATEAIRGGPAAVRSLARDVVRKHIGLFAMINALLELSPTMPISPENAELVEFAALGTKMPSPRDPNWRVAARRALVQELLAKAAGTGETGAIDALASVLGDSYKNRLSALGGASGGIGDVADARTLLSLVTTLRSRWDQDTQRASPSGRELSTLVEIRKRAAARGAVASNIVQRFVAEQFACVELMAYVVVAEEPARAARVTDVMAAFATARRSATHITGQVLAGEVAMAELWAVRMSG